MSTTKTQRFDQMIPFFGVKNDNRVRLYLDVLEHQWNKLVAPGVKAGSVTMTSNWDSGLPRLELLNKHFTTPDVGIDGNQVHSEWKHFRATLECRLSDKTMATFSNKHSITACNTDVSGDEVLNIIKMFGNDNSDMGKFFQAVIIAHLENLSITPGAMSSAMVSNPRTWYNATDFQFKNSFDNVFGTVIVSNRRPSNSENFGFALNKYSAQLLIEEAGTNAVATADTFWDDVNNNVDDETFYRKVSDPSKLFRVDSDGNEVEVGVRSSKFKDEMAKTHNECNVIQSNNTNTADCANYINRCIVNGSPTDIMNCKTYMTDPSFWDNMKSEVTNMLPTLLVKTLHNFGFTRVKNSDGNDMFCSVNAWVKGLTDRVGKDLTQLELDNITKNTKLMAYLELLVAKVNSNPAILNENYVASTRDPAEHANRFKDTYLTKIRVHPRIEIINNSKSSSGADISRYLDLIRRNSDARRSLYESVVSTKGSAIYVNGLPFTMGMIAPVYMMRGAGVSSSSQENIMPNSKLFENAFNQLNSALSYKNKHLDVSTINKFKQLLSSYKNTEYKLIKSIAYLTKYIELIETHRSYDKNNVLTMQDVLTFVNARTKYEGKLELKQDTLLNQIQIILDMVNDNLNNNSTNIVNGNYVNNSINATI